MGYEECIKEGNSIKPDWTPPDPVYQCGDIVRLKSGGPEMTVAGELEGEPEIIQCVWFNGLEAQTWNFSLKMLDKVNK